ncbi:MAG: DUF309 domain-containing protein [Cyanobacteria bacterium P01_A01_bin.114]
MANTPPPADIDSLPDDFWIGVEQFNQGDYYACHDTLEALWMDAIAPQKPFYQGILQIAVGLYHLGNQNWHGAAILLGEGSHRLAPFEPAFGGIDVAGLVDQAHVWLGALQQTGPTGIQTLARALTDGSPAKSTSEKALKPVPKIQSLTE